MSEPETLKQYRVECSACRNVLLRGKFYKPPKPQGLAWCPRCQKSTVQTVVEETAA